MRLKVLAARFALASLNSFAQEELKEPKAIYERIRAIEYAQKTRNQIAIDNKEMPCWFGCQDDDIRFKLENDLSKQAETDPVAAFYRGLFRLETAQLFSRNNAPLQATEQAAADARKLFLFAYRAGIAAAAWNLGVIYETGVGVTGSRLAAIEWYARAGQQYLKGAEREKALAALEKIESFDQKHSDSKRLREALFPTNKKNQD